MTGCNNAATHNPTLQELSPVQNEEILSFSAPDDLDLDSSFEEIKVYPNPVNDVLTIEFEAAQAQQISVMLTAMNGRKIIQLQPRIDAGQQDMTMDVSGMSPGLYALTIMIDQELKAKVVVIQ